MKKKSVFNKIEKNYIKSTSLSARFVKSGATVIIGSIFEKALRLLRNIVLTRILAPEAFGIIALVLSTNKLFESLSELGIKKAIIQNTNGSEDTFLNGAWWLSIGRATSLYIIVFLLVPSISRFYKNSDLILLMRVAFLAIIFNGAVSSKVYVEMKKVDFIRPTIVFNGSGILGIATAVFLAMKIKNVWALVIGFVAEASIRMIMSHIFCPFKPQFKFVKSQLSSLFKYTRGMVGIPFLYFLFIQIDVFVIGKIMTVNKLGLYSVAISLARLPFEFIAYFVDTVMMPVLSELQENYVKINKTIIDSTLVIMLLGFPALFMSIFYGKEMLRLFYGNAYAVVGIPFAIIVASEFLRVCSTPIATTYFASGYPGLHRLFTGIRALVVITLIYPAVRFLGLVGASTTILVAMIIGYIFQALRIRKISGISLKKYFSNFLHGIIPSTGIIIIGIINTYFWHPRSFPEIILGIIACIGAYLYSVRVLIIFFNRKNIIGNRIVRE